MRYSLFILALTALTSCVAALGINCLGSSMCHNLRNNANPGQSVADSLRQEIAAHVSDSRWYYNGQHIVCYDLRVKKIRWGNLGSICAFLQGTGGLPGNEIKKLAQRIVDNGCRSCGSVPVFFDKGDNDVHSHGELTFNYVSRDTSDDGRCSSIQGWCQYA